jgi:hypothetical protein
VLCRHLTGEANVTLLANRHTIAKLLLALVAAVFACQPASAAEKDVTMFILTKTAVPRTVNYEWKKNCNEFFCGPLEQKGTQVIRVTMDKKSDTKIKVIGTVEAVASFGALSPLMDRQTVLVTGEANPVACTFKLDKLTFADGFAQFLVDVFAGLDGKVYPFRDRRGRCDQYFPKDL